MGKFGSLGGNATNEHIFTFFGRNLSLNRRVMAVCESLPPPVQNHLIHLLPQGLHVGIGKASVQRAHAGGRPVSHLLARQFQCLGAKGIADAEVIGIQSV
jgi:hypothetical protein